MADSKCVTLNNGLTMPIVGLGTWLSSSEDVERAVNVALEVGYRHIDTAFIYFNEEAVGKALKKFINSYRGSREQLFITTKLPLMGLANVEHFCELSLQRLGLSYVDLYLIHGPFAAKYKNDEEFPHADEDGNYATENIPVETIWGHMEELVKAHRTKSIGLSNFNASQVERIMKVAKIKPAVLQIELHAYMQQKELRNLCQKYSIVVESYSSLASPGRADILISNQEATNLLQNPVVLQLAEKCNKSPAQILLRHLIQQQIVVIPKSITPERIKENLDIFDFFLTPLEMKALDELDRGESGRTLDFEFLGRGVKDHPEYPFAK